MNIILNFPFLICENLRNLWIKTQCTGLGSVDYPQITQISADFSQTERMLSYFLLPTSPFKLLT